MTAIGALFPRFVFRPLEEGFYLHFCKLKKDGENARRDLPVILRLSLLLGLICVCIGSPQAWSILFLFGGEKVSGKISEFGHMGPFLLQTAFINTLFCALNGILEG